MLRLLSTYRERANAGARVYKGLKVTKERKRELAPSSTFRTRRVRRHYRIFKKLFNSPLQASQNVINCFAGDTANRKTKEKRRIKFRLERNHNPFASLHAFPFPLFSRYYFREEKLRRRLIRCRGSRASTTFFSNTKTEEENEKTDGSSPQKKNPRKIYKLRILIRAVHRVRIVTGGGGKAWKESFFFHFLHPVLIICGFTFGGRGAKIRFRRTRRGRGTKTA